MSNKIKIDAAGRRLGQQGTKAWKKIKKTNAETYDVWMELAESFQSGRAWAMHEAGTNTPKGSGYNQAMSDWLAEFELVDFDGSDRARLLNYLENSTVIEDYCKSIKLDFKAYSLPTLFKKWKAATQPKKARQPKAAAATSVTVEAKETRFTIEQHFAALTELLLALPDQDQARDLVNAFVTKLQKVDLKNARKTLKAEAGAGSLSWEEHQKTQAAAKAAIMAKKPKTKTADTLVWEDNGCGIEGYPGYRAKTTAGQYDITPGRNMLNGMKFSGYSASYFYPDANSKTWVIKVDGKDTKAARVDLGSARTADKAKAIAEAHYAKS